MKQSTKVIDVFIADDGKVFLTAAECEEYEEVHPAQRWLDNDSTIYWRDVNAKEIIDSLLQAFDITPKKKDPP